MNPIQVTFRGMTVSEALAAHIQSEYEKLGRVFDRIQSGHAVVEQAHRHHVKGRHFQVHLNVHVPGKEIVVNRDPAERDSREDPYEAVDEAFAAALRQLKSHAERLHDYRPEAP